jgi:peptidoglycan/xylan/chitin deacetylase (PgdA/CDA1 family)
MELNEARDYLHIVTGQSIDYFAYPYGDYNRLVAEAVREAGFGTAFTVDPIPVGLPAYEIPRVGIYYARPDYLSVKLSGLHRPALRGPALPAGNGR